MSGHPRTPSQIIGEMLTGRPEAASLLAEASHCQALARASAAIVRRTFAAAQAARLGYEELLHRLDPRRRRTVNFGTGLLIIGLLGAGLTLLDAMELGGMWAVLPALAATAAWLTGAWLAALACRDRRWPLVLAAAVAALLVGLLLVGMHGLGPHPGWPTPHARARESLVLGLAVGMFILLLVVGAAVLMARMESASLFLARRRWHRARAEHEAAVKTAREDDEVAEVSTAAWLGLVRAYATGAAGGDEHLVHEAVALGAALLDSGQPQLPGSEPTLFRVDRAQPRSVCAS